MLIPTPRICTRLHACLCARPPQLLHTGAHPHPTPHRLTSQPILPTTHIATNKSEQAVPNRAKPALWMMFTTLVHHFPSTGCSESCDNLIEGVLDEPLVAVVGADDAVIRHVLLRAIDRVVAVRRQQRDVRRSTNEQASKLRSARCFCCITLVVPLEMKGLPIIRGVDANTVCIVHDTANRTLQYIRSSSPLTKKPGRKHSPNIVRRVLHGASVDRGDTHGVAGEKGAEGGDADEHCEHYKSEKLPLRALSLHLVRERYKILTT